MITKLSRGLAKAEIFCASFLAILITLLILLNVLTRAMNASIYWVDEAAIYAMVWMTFLAASAGIHERSAVSVTVIKDMLNDRARHIMNIAIDLVVLLFVAAILYFLWRWLLPLDLLRAGFNIEAFQGETFNFVYAEPTTTLGIKKVWVWIIMVAFAFGAGLHAIANLSTTLRGGRL
ncbi:MAG: TRAP-type C4-dicarboxylate transport system permease small subunit [Ascidiaceihabitans sp.]|jgi:TRAP-type C4-dicarboxylate transport system permease small subunit